MRIGATKKGSSRRHFWDRKVIECCKPVMNDMVAPADYAINAPNPHNDNLATIKELNYISEERATKYCYSTQFLRDLANKQNYRILITSTNIGIELFCSWPVLIFLGEVLKNLNTRI